MKGKKFLAGLLSVILAFNSNAAVLAVGEDGGPVSNPPAEHTVTIEASPETPAAGEDVILTASGVEDADSLQWQEMEADWTDIEGETSGTYSFTWTEELETATFRLAASWEGEDEPVYSNELTLTAAADEPDDPDDEPKDPDDEPKDPDDEPKNPDDEPKNPDDEPKNPDDEPDGTQRDGGTTSFASFEDAAEAYYGEGGSQGVGVVSVTMKGGESDHTVKAGALLQFEITYTFDAVPTYPYTNQPEPMFDKFQNTNLYLTLPEGLSISSDSTGHSATKVEGERNVWQIALGDITPTASAATSAKFTLNVLVEGNGVLPIGTEFDFQNGEQLLYLMTELPVLDRTDGNNTVWKTYTKKIVTQSTLDNLTSTTLDKWGITKTAGTPEVSAGKETVTVPFTVTIGLLGDEGIVSGSTTYGRYGRVPFKSITFTDTPEVKSRTGESITPESITVTPKFGEKNPVTLTGNSITMSTAPKDGELPIDTCSAHDVTLTNGSGNDAPYYSTYEVEVVYDYDDYFIANYYDANQEKLDVENTAQIEYKLAGETDTTTKEDSASVKIGEVTKPAAITISKYIVGAGGAKLYSYENFPSGDPVSGEVKFTITKKEDGTAPKLYRQDTDGTYQEMTGANGTVTLSNSGSGSVTVYLDPGTYVVKETAQPDNTAAVTDGENNANPKTVEVAAGETGTADFYNKETLGSITITKYGKKDGTESLLAGAKFGLYSNEDCTDNYKLDEATTDNGTITFSRLPYETYWVKEISAPEGYLLNSHVETAVLGEGEGQEVSVSLTFTNTYNGAYVKLTKKLDPGDGEYVAVDSSSEYYTDLQNAFRLQQKGEGDTWTDVAGKSFSLGSNGTTQAVLLPVYENNGTTPITYRFAEQLPEGFHGANGKDVTDSNGVRWAYSEKFDLKEKLGQGESEAKEITMYNTRNGSITVTKKFYDATVEGMEESTTQKEAAFDLYYKDGDGKYQRYNAEEKPYTTSSGKLTITDLPTSGESGAVRSYYLVEQKITDYELTGVKSGDGFDYSFDTEIDGKPAVGPFNFKAEANDKTDLSRAVTLTNVEQKVPVVIKKEDSYTHTFVSGAKYTIYAYDNGTKGNAIDEMIAVAIDSSGSFQKLEPGRKYLIEETVTPQGYQNVTAPADLVIDLTNFQVDANTKAAIYTIKNRPDPKLLITKVRVVPGGTAETITGVKFEVYTKNGDSFERVKDYDGSDLTLTSGTALQLPAGTYYLKEIEVNSDLLDPSKYSELYINASGERFKGEYDQATSSYYFGPIEVADQEENITKTIGNYAAKGAVKVKKLGQEYNSEDTKPLSDAEFTIYVKNADGSLSESKGTAVSSVSSGTATFTNLPIYDENGDKITYVIKETKAPNGYTASDESFEVQLEPGNTVTIGKKIDANGNAVADNTDLTFLNLPTVNFQVTKVYYNMWEHQFTSTEIALPGTVIALYVKGEDGKYHYTGQAQRADDLGQVTFTGLNQKDEYVAIEVSIRSDIPGYEYLEPERERLYLPWVTEDGKPTEEGQPEENYDTLTQEQLTKDTDSGGKPVGYNYVTKKALEDNANPIRLKTGKLTNVENWAQVHIFKYVEDINYTDGKRPVNNAEFSLYMEVIDEKNDTNTERTFDLTQRDNPDKYTLIGTYSSGTLYDPKTGERMDGWFSTSILKSADEIVYWLVEDSPGTGAELKPENKITLIRRDESGDTEYTNASTYTPEGASDPVTCTGVIKYKNNQVVEDEVENDPAKGSGSAAYSTVRIAKWAGSYDSDGNPTQNYTPLGNAVFELWLVDEKGTKLVQLDTLTTGLDNKANDAGQLPDDLTAWASSRAFSWDGLYKAYQDKFKSSFFTDAAGNGYVRAAVVETSAPAGYQASQSVYYLYMFFRNKAGDTTETFNDVFYEKNKTGGTLADTMEAGKFGFYPTKEEKQSTGGVTYEKIEVAETDMPADVQKDVTQAQFRLVNWPIDHFSVTVEKYGYEVNDNTLGKTSEELTKYFADTAVATPLAGVEMRLERYDSANGWTPYSFDNPSSSTLKTNANGSYTFPNGLPLGRYRLIETKSVDGYENIYTGEKVTVRDGADEDQRIRDEKAYYFQVTTEAVTVKLYNPAQLSLSVKKLEMDGITPISGVSFRLTPTPSGAGAYTTVQRTDDNGIATFTEIPSGKYKLTETSMPTGYSNAYFAEWFQKEYAGDSYKGLADFVTTTGIFLGFKTELQGGDVVVTSRTDLSSYGIDTTPLTLSVRNPETVSLNIEKRDKDTNALLPGAEFTVEYLKFSRIDGTDITITSETTGWETVSKKPTMNENIYTLSNLTPGIYRVKEKKAPDGYDITDSSYHYVALTGGLGVGTVKVTTAEGTDINVTSYKTSNTTGNDNKLLFKDAKQVSLTVTKALEKGSLSVTGDHTFTFKLYEDANKANQVGTAQTIWVTNGTLQDDPTVTFSGLSQGRTYYLEEETGEDFALKSVTNGDSAITAGNSGLYAISVPDDGTNVSVTATNVYLYAEVCVLKVDGSNGTSLSGADFVVYRVDASGNLVATVTHDFTENSGVYTAIVSLKSNAAETFRIYETASPSGYVLDRAQYVEVTLRPGEKQAVPTWHPSYANQNSDMLQNRIFPNYQGAVIKITKYDNIHDANGQPLANVKFTLYRYNADNASWEFSQEATTNDAGMVEFKVPAGIYAVEETLPSGYAGFEGIWSRDANGKPTGSQAATVTATINATEHTLHRINGTAAVVVGNTYQYNAYNIPYVDLEIRKQLVEPNLSTTIPTATVNVYQVANGTEDTLTQAEVAQLMQDSKLIRTVTTAAAQSGEKYSTSGVLRDVITPGATYLIVETNSSVPQLRDNKDVVWYKVLHVPENAGKQTVTLKNLDANVTIDLEKTTMASNLTSLFESDATIKYTLKPTVTNSYPLTSLTITDNGLTAYHIPTGTSAATELDFDTYLKDKYSITSVTVPAASHVTAKYADGTSYPITATVTFYDFNDTKIYSAIVDADAEGAARTVTLPANKGKAKTISVSYASSEFEAATGYALGQNVTLGDLKLTVHLDRQTATGAEVKAISRIDNDATATAKYAPWGVDGVQATAQSQASDAAESVSFQMRKAAIVSVMKTADKTSVNLGEKVAYTVKITNASAAEAPFIDPFFVDFLPQGSSFASEKDDVEVEVTDSGAGAGSSLTLESITANTVSGETGVLFLFDGELKPGGSAEITFEVLANNAVTAYGTEMKNYVIVGSENKGYTTNDNPQGASFKNSNGQWAEKYSQVLSSVGDDRKTAFEKILGERSGYGYISENANVTWRTSSSVVLVKSAYGDRNEEDGYTTSEISVVDNGGTMHYRLTLSNVSSSDDVLTGISIIDLLPSEGDSTSTSGRWSEWGLNFGSITNVYKVYSATVGEATQQVMVPVAQGDYRVFYYTGPDVTTGNANAFYQNVEKLKFDTEQSAIPKDWTDASLTGDGLKVVKAFVVAMKESSGGDGVELIPTESLVIDYTATVNGGEELSSDELSAISYQNAVNSFATHYFTYTFGAQNPALLSADILDSNQVTATTLPDPVKVGGHIWIDKNADGIRDTDESIDNFSDVSIIQELLDKVQVRLFSFRGTSQTPSTTLFDKTTNLLWTANANFIFEDLNAAALNANLTPYQDEMDANNVLNPSKLKGSSPSTYQIEVSFPTTGSDAVAGIFQVTQINEPVLYSRDPMELAAGGDFADEAFDNNYKASGTSNVSERFYLWAYPETTFDNTKDIGLVPYRTLELTKTNEDGDSLAGAEFAIYGPFEPDAATHHCTEANLVGGQTYTTDADGKITVDDLLWYMDYVIVEKTAPADYTVSRATATAVSAETNLEKLSDGTWLLKTPADTKTDTTDKITVVNRKKTSDPPTDPPKTPLPPPEDGTTVSFTPTVRKAVLGDARSEEATFRFLLTADKNNPTGGATMSGTSVTITGSGTASFGSIVFREPGNYLFYLREDTAQPVSGYAYDAAVWTLRISVAELGDELVLVSTPVYEQGGTQRTGDAQFVNTYETPEEPPTEPPTTPPTTPDGGEPVPADIPQTGDETGFLLWLALLAVSGAGLAALGCRRLIARRRIRRANPPQK